MNRSVSEGPNRLSRHGLARLSRLDNAPQRFRNTAAPPRGRPAFQVPHRREALRSHSVGGGGSSCAAVVGARLRASNKACKKAFVRSRSYFGLSSADLRRLPTSHVGSSIVVIIIIYNYNYKL